MITPEPARPAKAGDQLLVDIKVFESDDEEPKRTSDDQEIELGKGALLEELEEALIGSNMGSQPEFETVMGLIFAGKCGNAKTHRRH